MREEGKTNKQNNVLKQQNNAEKPRMFEVLRNLNYEYFVGFVNGMLGTEI